MKTNYLCPVYWKWLQMHPEHAREHFTQTSQTALEKARSGEMETACQTAGEAFEMAQAVMLSIQVSDSHTNAKHNDLLAYGASAIQLARTHAASGNINEAVVCLDSAAQQIHALAPLFATEPDMLSHLRQISFSLQQGQAFYQRQTLSSRVLH